MKYLGGIGAVLFLVCFGASFERVQAVSGAVVISQVQLGGVGASKQEFIELFNNSTEDVNVTDWCLTYSDYKDESQTTLRCFTKPTGVDELRLPGRNYIAVASQTFPIVAGQPVSELFTSVSIDMSGARGHVRLINADKKVVDTVAWDNKANSVPPARPEAIAAVAPIAGKAIARSGTIMLIDTDNNSIDFSEQLPLLHAGELYEYVAPPSITDLCQLDGVQSTMPVGYGYDEAGNCEMLAADKCLNIDKVQLAVPGTMISDDAQNCLVDLCPNLPFLQTIQPEGYVLKNGTCVKLENRMLMITELLPNVSGSDIGSEFIEIYNPYESPVPLKDYKLQIGKAFEKVYPLVVDETATIEPMGWFVVRDSDLGFTLLNTTSGVRLITPSGEIASEVTYADPQDDMAWATIDGIWQYTNQLTPSAVNAPSVYEDQLEGDRVTVLGAQLVPCTAGKYRHSLTNRCRNIEADAAVLATCDADEYRSPDTNRCRKIATLTSTLASCEQGYVRNADTNRCRKVLAATNSPANCQSGYERNPETNRCRKVAKTNSVGFAKDDEAGAPLSALAVGSIIAIATGYGVYEWRREMRGALGWVAAKAKAAL